MPVTEIHIIMSMSVMLPMYDSLAVCRTALRFAVLSVSFFTCTLFSVQDYSAPPSESMSQVGNSLRSLTDPSPKFYRGSQVHDFGAIFDPRHIYVAFICSNCSILKYW